MDSITYVLFNDSYRRYDNTAWNNAKGNVIPIVNITTYGKNKRMLDFEIECIKDLDKQFGGLLNVFWESDLTKYKPLYSNKSSYKSKDTGFDFDYSFLANGYGNFTRPYKVYSNFVETWKDSIIPPNFGKKYPKNILVFPNGVFKDPKYTRYVPLQSNLLQGGRSNALAILKNLVKNHKSYHETRNIITIPTTNLSPYLNFGCISMREAAQAIKKDKLPALLAELWWREFYNQICHFFPELYTKGAAFYSQRDKWWLTGTEGKTVFESWKEGRTGCDIVDASMRCLNRTGMLHNRCRMIVASYLVKDMGIDWREGEKYFATQLLDYYFPSNNGGWQYISGTGPSSMMQSRKFNPIIQAKKYDPESKFVKKNIYSK